MKRLAFGLFLVLGNPGFVAAAEAPAADTGETADDKATQAESSASETPEANADEIPDLSDEVQEAAAQKTEAAAGAAAAQKSWEDIVVVPRRAFIKAKRVELAPFSAISINDTLIRHYSFGGDLSFYLTDVFSVGVEGQYFIKERSERESLIGEQFHRAPTLNKFKYSTSLVFGYVPGYGKFGLFNKYIVHWDLTLNAGIGVIWTETITIHPNVDNQYPPFGNLDIMPHLGISTRMFLANWLSLSIGIRDYIFDDKFENLGRPAGQSAALAKQNGQFALTQNIMVFGSIGFYLPPSFQYKTPR